MWHNNNNNNNMWLSKILSTRPLSDTKHICVQTELSFKYECRAHSCLTPGIFLRRHQCCWNVLNFRHPDPQFAVSFRLILVEIYLICIFGQQGPTCTSMTKIKRERDGITSSWPQLAVSFRLAFSGNLSDMHFWTKRPNLHFCDRCKD